MNNTKQTIETIDKAIIELSKLKDRLSFEQSLLGIVMKMGIGTWVINNENTYYQFSHYDGKLLKVHLKRHGLPFVFDFSVFEAKFHLASGNEVAEHETFLNSKGLPKMGDTKVCVYVLKDEYKEHFHFELLSSLFNGNPTTMFDENSISHHKVKDARIESWFERTIQLKSDSYKLPSETKNLIDPQRCEFYMVTCRGNYGSKVRHQDYNDAVKEAKRIARQENHPTWVVGVVKKINPWD